MRRASPVASFAPIAFFALLAACATNHAAVYAQSIAAPAATSAALAPDDRVRLAEAFRLATAVGDEVWPAWTSAPFAVLLVTPEREILLRHPRPTPDFTRVGHDSLLGTDVYERARVFSPNLLATFPAVSGVPTIVVGTAAATGKSSTDWVLTILHEHFHQLQSSRPGYFESVDALGLARGDKTGMWMLNYAFPYDSAEVRASFADLTRAIDSALAVGTSDWRAVEAARARLRAALPSDDDRYLAFQMWQEGVARYTELTVARWAAAHWAPSSEFRALGDFTSYASAAERLEGGIRAGLRDTALARTRRVAFYPAGAATALLLDRVTPGWRARYFERGYSLDAQLPRAGRHRVLFIGNSLTYANDLPGTLAALAAMSGDTIEVSSVTRPGYALIDHLDGATKTDALARIQGARWEFVVLQQGPTSRVIDRDTLVIAVQRLEPAIRAAGARPALYMVWPAAADAANFDAVRESFRQAACRTSGVFWPAGEAWRAAWRIDPALPLHGPDNFHPSPLGTYLVALVMYERVTGRDARALPARAVPVGAAGGPAAETIRVLQRAAHETNAAWPELCGS